MRKLAIFLAGTVILIIVLTLSGPPRRVQTPVQEKPSTPRQEPTRAPAQHSQPQREPAPDHDQAAPMPPITNGEWWRQWRR